MFCCFLDSLVKASRYYNNLSILKVLLNDVTLLDKRQRSGLEDAVLIGNTESVKYLLQKGANPDEFDERYNSKMTSLHYASLKGFFEIVQLLISNGASVNAIDKYNSTPLYYACQGGEDKIVQYLIEHGAHLHAKAYGEFTPLQSACENGHFNIVQQLIKKGAIWSVLTPDEETTLHLACKSGNLNIVKYLIQIGEDPNKVDEDEMTCLHHSCLKGVNYINILRAFLPTFFFQQKLQT